APRTPKKRTPLDPEIRTVKPLIRVTYAGVLKEVVSQPTSVRQKLSLRGLVIWNVPQKLEAVLCLRQDEQDLGSESEVFVLLVKTIWIWHPSQTVTPFVDEPSNRGGNVLVEAVADLGA